MKKIKILAIVSMGIFGWLCASNPANAQTYNVAVYLSYRGPANSTELWKSGDNWTVRGIPQNWGSLFDRQINAYPQIQKLLDNYGGDDKLTRTVDDNAIKSYLAPVMRNQAVQLYQQYGNGSPLNIRFVLLGQGTAGGFLARYISGSASRLGLGSIYDPANGRHVANASFAVIASGAPFQGSPLSEASLGPVSGYRDVESLLNDYEQTLQAALQTSEYRSFWGDVLNFLKNTVPNAAAKAVAAIEISSGNPSAIAAGKSIGAELTKEILTEFFNLITPKKRSPRDAGYQSLVSMLRVDINAARGVQAADVNFLQTNTYLRDLLKPNRGNGAGTLVNTVNNQSNPSYYRSLIGAEKSAIPYRVITEIRNTDLDDENEPVLINLYQGFVNACRAQADGWDHKSKLITTLFGAKQRCRDRRDRWRAGQYKLQGVDATWGSITGAYKMEQQTQTIRVYDPYKCSGGGGLPSPYALKAEDIDLLIPIDDPNCDPYRWETITTTVRVPLKSDGFLPPNYAVWAPGNNPNDQVHNYYYDDLGDGGYNDLELLRYRRTYTEGANLKGQLAKPMKQTHDWLQGEVLK